MVQLSTVIKKEEDVAVVDQAKVKDESGGTTSDVKGESADAVDAITTMVESLSVKTKSPVAQDRKRHPLDESSYALEVVDGVVPATPLKAPAVDTHHDGSWFVITVGFRVGIFPYWHEVKQLVNKCPGNTYKKYRSYVQARAAFETARLRNVVIEVCRGVN